MRFLLIALSLLYAVSASAASIETVVGKGDKTDVGNAPTPAAEAHMNQPFGVEFGPDGALYICERGNHRIRRWDPKTNEVTVYAGTGKAGYTGDGGPATEATLNEPHELRFDEAGDMYITDMRNHVVRKIDWKTKTVSTLAGTGEPGFSGDGGPANKAMLKQPHSVALDGKGNLYIADIGNHRIRRMDLSTGRIETIVGTGEAKFPRDGVTAQGEPIRGPRALFVDGDTLWIALREGNAVWRMNLAQGTIHHVAGTGVKGYAVNGGPCKDSQFAGPKGIAVGPDKLVYVVDSDNHCIRVIDPQALTVRTYAGIGPKDRGFGGDGGEPTEAKLNNPHAICITADGTMYIGDSDNHRVRRVNK